MNVSGACCCHFQVGLVQFSHTCAGIRQITLVTYDIIGNGQPFFAARLRCNDALGLLPGLIIADQQPFELHLRAAIHHQNPIHGIAHRRLEKQWHHDDDVGLAGFVGALVSDVPNQRMKDALELRPTGVVGEDDAPHRGAVQPAVIIDDRIAELLPDSIDCWRARGDDFSCDNVGIDNRRAEFRKEVGYSGFAAGNAARETDSEGRFSPGRDSRVSRGFSP